MQTSLDMGVKKNKEHMDSETRRLELGIQQVKDMHKALSDEIWGPEERAMRSKRMKTEVERSVLGRFRLQTKAFRAETSLKRRRKSRTSRPRACGVTRF